jgi:hypothetical protein
MPLGLCSSQTHFPQSHLNNAVNTPVAGIEHLTQRRAELALTYPAAMDSSVGTLKLPRLLPALALENTDVTTRARVNHCVD